MFIGQNTRLMLETICLAQDAMATLRKVTCGNTNAARQLMNQMLLMNPLKRNEGLDLQRQVE